MAAARAARAAPAVPARPAAPARAPTSRARGARSARASVSRRASRIVGAAASDDATRSLAAELATLVRSDSPSDARVLELIAALEDARAPADLRAFDGAFEVAWSEGTMAWRALVAEAVQAIAGRCRAGQRFALASSSSDAAASSSEPNANAALNFAELFGGAVTITASGVFRPDPSIADAADPNAVASGARCPLPFDVRIARGDARLFDGAPVDLPIRGPGAFEVLYGDERVRVFRSSGGIAVQVPSDWVPPNDGGGAARRGRNEETF